MKKAIDHVAGTDPRFAALIARARRFDVVADELVRPFDALAESIAYQQLSGKAAATIWGRVRALYGILFGLAWRMGPESVALHSGSLCFNGAFLTLMPA